MRRFSRSAVMLVRILQQWMPGLGGHRIASPALDLFALQLHTCGAIACKYRGLMRHVCASTHTAGVLCSCASDSEI